MKYSYNLEQQLGSKILGALSGKPVSADGRAINCVINHDGVVSCNRMNIAVGPLISLLVVALGSFREGLFRRLLPAALLAHEHENEQTRQMHQAKAKQFPRTLTVAVAIESPSEIDEISIEQERVDCKRPRRYASERHRRTERA